MLSWLDVGAVVVPLGQAIGRWGNFANEELYGKPTSLPWGLKIENPPVQYAGHTRFHPLFLYESLWSLITFCVLLWVWLRFRDRLKRGDVLLIYLILYPTARFFLEFLRIEVTLSGGINVSQAVSANAALISTLLLIYRHRDALARWLKRQPDSREEESAA
jgi:phosphatidylglycerol:prolipoprotein diacylglycerol transferase